MTFHWYGFLVGIGIVVCITSIEFALKKVASKKNSKEVREYFWQLLAVILISAFAGARAWHGVTDFHLYRSNLLDLLWINQGGLSILGAVLGGALGILFFQWFKKKQAKFTTLFWLDIAVLGVPFGQMIGRLGNWVNQELYGLPTTLPWAIFIDAPYRVPGYEQFETFHPLFLYEILLLAPLSFIMWKVFFKNQHKIGTGFFIALYGAWYGLGRFLLEFIRIDKATLPYIELGINQVVLLVLAIFCLVCLFVSRSPKTSERVTAT